MADETKNKPCKRELFENEVLKALRPKGLTFFDDEGKESEIEICAISYEKFEIIKTDVTKFFSDLISVSELTKSVGQGLIDFAVTAKTNTGDAAIRKGGASDDESYEMNHETSPIGDINITPDMFLKLGSSAETILKIIIEVGSDRKWEEIRKYDLLTGATLATIILKHNSGERMRDFIRKLQEAMMEIYHPAQKDGSQSKTSSLKTDTASEKSEVGQKES